MKKVFTKSCAENQCPICNSYELEPDIFEFLDDRNVSLISTCRDCGAKYKIWYKLEFDCLQIGEKMISAPKTRVEVNDNVKVDSDQKLKYCFNSSYGNATREETEEFLMETNKPIKYTCGFKFSRPTIYMKPIDREEALKLFKNGNFFEVEECEDYVDMNEYSSSDLY